MANEAEIQIVIVAKDHASKILNQAGKEAQGLGKTVAGTAAGFIAAEVAMKAFSGALKFGLGNAIDFEKQIDQVGAVAGATASEMKGLSEAALRIGAATSKSAGEAAQAMEMLAANGLTAGEIMNGAADAAVALSEAGGTTLAIAADTASTAMAVWGLKTSELTDVVNRLAGAANVSRFGVEDMSAAISQGAGAAATAGISFQDFSTAIAMTATSFASGSDAGTAFKTFILALAGNSDKAREAMTDLGIITATGANTFFDAQGKVKGMSDIVQILHDKLGPLSQEMQITYLKQIFGNDAFRMAAGLMKSTGDEFSAMSQKMKDTDAAEVARMRMDNLSGKMEELKGSMETLGISIGTALIPALSGMAEFATGAVNAIGELPGSTQALVLGFGGLVTVMPLVVGAGSKMLSMFSALAAGQATLSLRLAAGATVIGAVAVAADLIVQKFAGRSLFDMMFGNDGDERAKRVAEALEQYNYELTITGKSASDAAPNVERLAKVNDDLRSSLHLFVTDKFGEKAATDIGIMSMSFSDLGNYIDEWKGKATEGNSIAEDFVSIVNKQTPAVQAVGQSMLDAGASYMVLVQASNTLTGPMQAVFDKTVGLKDKTEAYNQVLFNEQGMFYELSAAAALTAAGMEKTAAGVDLSRAAFDMATPGTQAYLKSIGALATSSEDAKQAAENLARVIDELNGRFATFNPQIIAAKANNAALNEELEDLVASGKEYSESLGMTKKEIEGAIEANDKFIKSGESNEKALKGQEQAIKLLIGEGGYAALQSAMANSGRTAEEQMETTRDLSKVYSDLAQGSISQAIGKFMELKKELSPQEWKILAESAGPPFKEALSKIADPATLDKLAADMRAGGLRAGAAIAEGLAGELRTRTQQINEFAYQMGAEAIAGLMAGTNSQSPSKDAQEIGAWVVEGLLIGMDPGMAYSGGEALGFAVIQGLDAALVGHGIDAVATFGEALNAEFQKLSDQITLGSQGAGFMDKLIEAITTGTPAAIDALASAGFAMYETWREAFGDEKATALLNEFWIAVNTALATGGAEGIAIIQAFLAQVKTDMEGGLFDLQTAFSTFSAGVAKAAADMDLENKLGAQGAKMFTKLIDAITTGSAKTLDEVAKMAAGIMDTIKDKLPPEQAEFIIKGFMDAMNTVLSTGGAEGVDTLQAMMTMMNQILQGGAIDLKSGTVVMGQTIKDLATDLGMSADEIIANLGSIVDLGLVNMVEQLGRLPEEAKKMIAEVVKAVLDGVMSAEDGIKKIKALAGTGGGAGVGSPVSGGGPAGAGSAAGIWKPGGTPNTGIVYVPNSAGGQSATFYNDLPKGTPIWTGTDSYGNSYSTTDPSLAFPGQPKSAAGGDYETTDGLYRIHAKEMILPPAIAEDMRDMIGQFAGLPGFLHEPGEDAAIWNGGAGAMYPPNFFDSASEGGEGSGRSSDGSVRVTNPGSDMNLAEAVVILKEISGYTKLSTELQTATNGILGGIAVVLTDGIAKPLAAIAAMLPLLAGGGGGGSGDGGGSVRKPPGWDKGMDKALAAMQWDTAYAAIIERSPDVGKYVSKGQLQNAWIQGTKAAGGGFMSEVQMQGMTQSQIAGHYGVTPTGMIPAHFASGPGSVGNIPGNYNPQPTGTIVIQAMDAQSFEQFLNKNSGAVYNTLANEIKRL